MKTIPHRLHDPLNVMHALLTAVIGGWAILLALPRSIFATSDRYQLFAEVMPERAWSIAFLIVFCISAIGMREGHPRWRRAATQMLSFTHALIAVLIGVNRPLATGTFTYATLALFAAYVVWKDSHP